MQEKPFIIAIDGTSASGKGTIAKKLAARLGFAYLDTGLLYRAVGFAIISVGGDAGDAELAETAALVLAARMSGAGERPPPPTPCPRGAGEAPLAPSMPTAEAKLGLIDFSKLLDNEILRTGEAGVAASKVAAVPAVRDALMKFQKDFCAKPPGDAKGAVLDGRDIGTVIAPDAEVKIFVTADPKTRAERRFKELQARGENVTFESVLADMKARDARDANRPIAPTKPAPDAIVLDTTELNAEQALRMAVEIVSASLGI